MVLSFHLLERESAQPSQKELTLTTYIVSHAVEISAKFLPVCDKGSRPFFSTVRAKSIILNVHLAQNFVNFLCSLQYQQVSL